jgi:predicted nucleotidyltransferase
MLTDCDYVRDKENKLYIVKGYWNKSKMVANLAFAPDANGNRYNAELDSFYRKVIDDNVIPILLDRADVAEVYKPKETFQQSYKILPEPWKTFAQKLADLVGVKNVGIFGSYLIGFDIIKDVDFIVYGLENLFKIKNNISEISNSVNGTQITDEHIQYQIKKHAKNFSKFSNFDKLLMRKWSSVQIAPGILSTIRFAYKQKEIPKNPFSSLVEKQITITGKVVSDIGSNFCPRMFEIESNGKIFTVATYLWIYQSCVRTGDIVSVKGNLHEDGKTITLTEFSHGIRLE